MRPYALDDDTPVPPNYPKDDETRRPRVASDYVVDFHDDAVPEQPVRRRGIFTVLVVARTLSGIRR